MRAHPRFQKLRRSPFSSGWNWVVGLLFSAPWTCIAQTQPTNYSVLVEPRFSSIANHLNRGDNSLNTVIPEVPPGTAIYKWDPATQGYFSPAFYEPGFGWFSQDPEALFLRPGEGAFIQVTQTFPLPFSGTVVSGSVQRPLVPGLNFVSGHQPRTMDFGEVFGFQPQPGDEVYLYDQPFTGSPDALQQNASSIHKFTPHGWDYPPAFKRGRSAFVFLTRGPRIVTHPQRKVVNAGETVRFDVSVLGEAPFSYQWQFNEDDLPGATSPSLILNNVQFPQNGVYSVVVSNRFGTAPSRQAHLLVRSAPVILEEPKPVQAVVSNDVVFMVRAMGSPDLRYQWFRNNEPLPNQTSAFLVLKSVNPQLHSGAYHVRISNPFGVNQTQPVPLTVVFPPRIILHPASQVVRRGDRATFIVEAEGTQPLSYQWRLNGNNIPTGTNTFAGGTNSVLTVSNVQPKHSGSYYVTVANVAGAVDSDRALLSVVDVQPIFLSDSFEGAQIRSELSFTARGNNLDSGPNEDKEPLHCGRQGGSSVWLGWVSTKQGIVTFDSTGSSFDTVLAAYTGRTLGDLVEVACDDDQGEFFGSRISFNVVPNVVYYIAIDGLDAQRGHILLDWNLDSTTLMLPVIVQQPEDQTAPFGSDVFFSVRAVGNIGCYQWYYNDFPIAGAIRDVLQLRSVRPEHAGYYSVRLFTECNKSNRTVLSRRATLQFSFSGVESNLLRSFTWDKFADAADRTPRPAPPPPGIVFAQDLMDVAAAAVSPVSGYTGTQIFNTFSSGGEEGEIRHCGIPGGASQWFTYRPQRNGALYLNTAGSAFNTVLAVYTGPGPLLSSLRPLICDNDSGPGTTSSLSFQANSNTTYYIAVDGFHGASGLAQLNYRLLIPMTLTNIFMSDATTCHLSINATPSYPFTIERCAGFASWTPLLTTNRPTMPYEYYDTNATVSKRFYRLVQTP